MDRLCFGSCLNKLSRLQILRSKLERLANHSLHFLVRQAVGRLHLEGLNLTRAHVLSGHVEDPVGVNEEHDFDPGHARWKRGHLELKPRQAAVVLR